MGKNEGNEAGHHHQKTERSKVISTTPKVTRPIYEAKRGVTQDIIIRGQRFRLAQIAQEFPDARMIQASAGVQHDLSTQVGDALSLTPGDDQDGRWGDIFCPQGFGFGFASGDTKPYSFWHTQHLTSMHF